MKYNWIQIIYDHYDSIIEAMKRLELKDTKYNIDLYLYPDGKTSEFDNPGGNCYINDNHFVIYTSNHQGWDGNFETDCFELNEYVESALDARIDELKADEAIEQI